VNTGGGVYPETWTELLSKKLNLKLNNYGFSSSGNDLIFETFCDRFNELRKGDTVIVGWSYHTRVNYKFDIDSDIIDKIAVYRNQEHYKNQFLTYQKVIDKICKCLGVNVYYWSGDRDVIYKLDKKLLHDKKYLLCDKIVLDEHGEYTPFNNVFNLGGQTIEMETNGLIKDKHFGESAHNIMANLFYEHITNFKKNMI
jgi:DNA-binding Lrp family transcriptional regulator